MNASHALILVQPLLGATEDMKRRKISKSRCDELLLSINSIPWANVFVDGELKGATPLETSVAAGRHEIVLRSKSGKVIKEFTTEVRAGDHRVHSFDDGTR